MCFLVHDDSVVIGTEVSVLDHDASLVVETEVCLLLHDTLVTDESLDDVAVVTGVDHSVLVSTEDGHGDATPAKAVASRAERAIRDFMGSDRRDCSEWM